MNVLFQIKYSVEVRDVKMITELLMVQESLAKDDLKAEIIDKERYRQIVMKTKQRLVISVLKLNNKL